MRDLSHARPADGTPGRRGPVLRAVLAVAAAAAVSCASPRPVPPPAPPAPPPPEDVAPAQPIAPPVDVAAELAQARAAHEDGRSDDEAEHLRHVVEADP